MSPVPFNDLLRLVEQGDVKAGKALDQMAHYLGVGLAILVTGLAPDVVVVVGEVTGAWNRVGPVVERAIRQRSFTHAPTRIVPTDPENLPPARGHCAGRPKAFHPAADSLSSPACPGALPLQIPGLIAS
jgi:predicted NBD/HSP70 family sugar kinase